MRHEIVDACLNGCKNGPNELAEAGGVHGLLVDLGAVIDVVLSMWLEHDKEGIAKADRVQGVSVQRRRLTRLEILVQPHNGRR